MREREISKNEDVLSVQDQDVSKIGETDAIKELRRAILENVPKSEKEKHGVDRKEFRESWKKGLVHWGSQSGILEEQVGDFHEMGNREHEEHRINNALSGSQLGDFNTY